MWIFCSQHFAFCFNSIFLAVSAVFIFYSLTFCPTFFDPFFFVLFSLACLTPSFLSLLLVFRSQSFHHIYLFQWINSEELNFVYLYETYSLTRQIPYFFLLIQMPDSCQTSLWQESAPGSVTSSATQTPAGCPFVVRLGASATAVTPRGCPPSLQETITTISAVTTMRATARAPAAQGVQNLGWSAERLRGYP